MERFQQSVSILLLLLMISCLPASESGDGERVYMVMAGGRIMTLRPPTLRQITCHRVCNATLAG